MSLGRPFPPTHIQLIHVLTSPREITAVLSHHAHTLFYLQLNTWKQINAPEETQLKRIPKGKVKTYKSLQVTQKQEDCPWEGRDGKFVTQPLCL